MIAPLQITMSHWKWTLLLSGNLNIEKSLASAVPVTRLYLERLTVRTRWWWWSFFLEEDCCAGRPRAWTSGRRRKPHICLDYHHDQSSMMKHRATELVCKLSILFDRTIDRGIHPFRVQFTNVTRITLHWWLWWLRREVTNSAQSIESRWKKIPRLSRIRMGIMLEKGKYKEHLNDDDASTQRSCWSKSRWDWVGPQWRVGTDLGGGRLEVIESAAKSRPLQFEQIFAINIITLARGFARTCEKMPRLGLPLKSLSTGLMSRGGRLKLPCSKSFVAPD